MLSKDKQLVQELLGHPAWDLFRGLVFQDKMVGNQLVHQSLKGKLQADLLAAGRSGDGIKAARVSGQLDILDVVFDVLPKYLKG